jgi:thiamine biosynthesis protein ThiI
MENLAGKHLIVHFDEVALKGGRRREFVHHLIRNICQHAPPLNNLRAKSLYDRILLGPIDEVQNAVLWHMLPGLPGVAWFSPVHRFEAQPTSFPQIAALFRDRPAPASFAVRTRRAKKDFPLNSPDINRELGRLIQEHTGWPVNLDEPELSIHLDVTPQGLFVYSQKERGPGGLPVGSTGKLVCLLSGGIDSPVAAYKLMCRGCKIVFVHFHNFGPQSGGVKRKLIQIVEQLSRFQGRSRLYLAPFAETQSELIAAVPPRMRMVAYRRAMLQLATPIARAERAGGLVLGDSLGQVASQTLENLQATYTATDLLVLTPLIGDGKRGIMDLAKQIGTYEPSILPYEDCCQLLVAKSPETRCDPERMAALEAKLNLAQRAAALAQAAEALDISPTFDTQLT